MIDGHPCPPATQCWYSVEGCTYRRDEHPHAITADAAVFYSVVATVRQHSTGVIEVLHIENQWVSHE